MEDYLYDVIIIGGGPAGSSCAFHLKYLNETLSVLLLDKQPFPRYKPCGGGISPEVVNYLNFSIDEVIDFVCDDISVVADNKRINTGINTDNKMWMVQREQFDHFLLEKAKEQGVRVETSCEVLEVIPQKERIQVVTPKARFIGRYVVLAEGGQAKIAKKMGLLVKHKLYAAMEYEHYTQSPSPKLEINLDRHPFGYAWQFPKSNGLSIGIGGDMKQGAQKKNQGLPSQLKKYLNDLGIKTIDKAHVHGHPILVYNGRSKLVHNRVLLIGEIAGCVDPLTGEGIRPAIKSAYLAAQALNDVLVSNKHRRLRQYERQFHQQIGKDLNYARLILWMNTRFRDHFLKSMSPQRLKGFLNIFTGNDNYCNHISLRRFLKVIKQVLCR